MVHTGDEQENYHGQTLLARYLMTETWRSEAGEWKLPLVHAYAVLKDPPAISLAPEPLQQYVGRYLGGNDLVYLIGWDGKQLQGDRPGGTTKPLVAEVRDVLYISGRPRSRKIFQRDMSAKITGFVDRREGSDFVWRCEGSGPS
jgi:hypothetical protein